MKSAVAFRRSLFLRIGDGPAEEAHEDLWVQTDGLHQVGNGLVQAVLLPIGEAPVAVGFSVVRVDFDSLGEVGDAAA